VPYDLKTPPGKGRPVGPGGIPDRLEGAASASRPASPAPSAPTASSLHAAPLAPASPLSAAPPLPPASPLPPAPPLPAALESPGGPDWRRPLLVALLVLMVGAALGAAAFAAEQRAFVWRPAVEARASGGWTVTGSAGLRPSSPTLAADHLVWSQGARTCVLDLESGDAHVVGAATPGSSVWPSAAGDCYVAWIEVPRGSGAGSLWVYDLDLGRRQRFAVGRAATSPAVCDDLVAWYGRSPDGTPRVEAIDMRSGRRAVLVEDPGIEEPVLGADDGVAWVTRSERGPAVVVRDLAAQTQTTVALAASGTTVDELRLAGHTLLWSIASGSDTRVVTFDLDTRATSVVARGLITAAATDGREVIWAEGGSPSGEGVVRGRSLAGGAEYEVGVAVAPPTSLAVGSGWVAWTFDDGGTTYLETSPLRR